jgi:hypothetical protein
MCFSLMTNGPLSHTLKNTERLNKLDQAVMPLAYTWETLTNLALEL